MQSYDLDGAYARDLCFDVFSYMLLCNGDLLTGLFADVFSCTSCFDLFCIFVF